MKNLKNIFFLLLMITLTCSCGGDDEQNAINDDLQGNWSAVTFSANVNSTSNTQNGTSMSQAEYLGSNFDYTIDFDGSNWTTTGSYTISSEVTTDGLSLSSGPKTVSDANGSGTHSTNGDQITVSESILNFQVLSAPMTRINEEEQTATFSIDADRLTIEQNETFMKSESGTNTTINVISKSVWER